MGAQRVQSGEAWSQSPGTGAIKAPTLLQASVSKRRGTTLMEWKQEAKWAPYPPIWLNAEPGGSHARQDPEAGTLAGLPG